MIVAKVLQKHRSGVMVCEWCSMHRAGRTPCPKQVRPTLLAERDFLRSLGHPGGGPDPLRRGSVTSPERNTSDIRRIRMQVTKRYRCRLRSGSAIGSTMRRSSLQPDSAGRGLTRRGLAGLDKPGGHEPYTC